MFADVPSHSGSAAKPASSPKSAENPKPHADDARDAAVQRAPDEFDRALESAGQASTDKNAPNQSDNTQDNDTAAQEEGGNLFPVSQEIAEPLDPSATLEIASQFVLDDQSKLQFGIGQFGLVPGESFGLMSGQFTIDALQNGAQSTGTGLSSAFVAPSTQPNLLTRLQGMLAQSGMPINSEVALLEQQGVGFGSESSTLKSLGAASTQEADADVQRALQTATTESKTTLPGVKTELSIPVKVGSEGWSDAMAGRINMLVNQRISSARIQVTPADLGPIEVRVNINSDQASVQFSSPSAQVRDALEQSIPRLREMLESAGFSLADSGVNDQSAGGQKGDAQNSDEPEAELLDETQVAVAQRQTLGLIDDFV